jgi:peptide/nickel transport system substrate-binding protein
VHRQHRTTRSLAAILTLALLGSACGGDDDDTGSGDAEPRRGGEITIGAEQWVECLNPITQCSNSSWLTWTVLHHVLPKLYEVTPEGTYEPTAVLDGEAETSGEGTGDGDGPFTVTYTLAEDAVWEDGSPMTSSDIRFTWEARMGTTGIVTASGYDRIADVDDSDPRTAVVTFTEPYAAWRDLFGGGTEYFLKEAAFDEGQLDLADEMLDEIPFSGAPFVLEEWSAEELTLVPNEAYWDEERRPLVDRVTMIPLEDSETEITALRSGQVDAIYPQPIPGMVDELGDLDYEVGFGVSFEALWLNLSSRLNPDTVLRHPEVREALLYAFDRQAYLDEIVRPDIPETELLNCMGWVPGVGDWCDPSDFEDVEHDPDRAAEILEEAGWAKGDDGIYARDGERLSFTFQTVAGNRRREDIQARAIPELQEVGIEAVQDNYDAGTLFEQRLPQMQSELMLYAWTASPDPSVTTFLACESVPATGNEFSGQNFNGWCNEEATDLMHEADRTVDEAQRLELTHQIGDLVREDAVALPLWQLPLITAWDGEAIGGPVGEYNTTPQGGFGNLYDWSVE